MTFFLVCVIIFLFFSNAIGWGHAAKRKKAIVELVGLTTTILNSQMEFVRQFRDIAAEQLVDDFKKQLDEMD